MGLKVTDFDYELPENLIATAPAEPRDSARLLHLPLGTGAIEHLGVRDLPGLLRAGDLLVLNDTRVRPWRLCGARPGGGKAECLILRLAGDGQGEGFVKPTNKLAPGDLVQFEAGAVRMLLREHHGGGRWSFVLSADGDVVATVERVGRAPLPPYIKRDGREDRVVDRERYQTVFAAKPGAVAAPTAGLHFTPELLARIAAMGVATAYVTLHVGEGTFAPVRVEQVEEHRMHSEWFELPAATATAVAAARARGSRVIAVGTTACRVLETCAAPGRVVRAAVGETDIFLHPERPPQVIDGLLTNFHLPQSTLLMLVAAFAGRDRVLAAYREAVARGYRFFSFGDAMLIQ